MTIKELKAKLDEMSNEAEVIIVDSLLCRNRIQRLSMGKNTIHKDGVVYIYTYDWF